MVKSPGVVRLGCALVLVALCGAVRADDPNVCDAPGDAPDLTLGVLSGPALLATIDGVSAYSIGSTSCNVGTCWVNWAHSTPSHPVFTQNLYRLEDGRFEQLGLSWVFHQYFALSQTACNTGCLFVQDGGHLGVNCSSPNTASSHAFQGNLGRRSEVNAATGQFPFPFGQQASPDGLAKRLQVAHVDLDPALHPTAQYFYEGHTVSADDAAAGAAHNNVSYRQVNVAAVGGVFNLAQTGATVSGAPALHAWAAADPGVLLSAVDVPGDGRFWVASRATDLGSGLWHYEYAIHNLGSHRSAASVSVPVFSGAPVSNVRFHDVNYHSGEPYSGEDWDASVGTAITWATDGFDVDPNANALRWGTVYNFRFDAELPPMEGELTIGLFRPGVPGAVSAAAVVPIPCDADAVCEAGENSCVCPSDCGAPAASEFDCADGLDEDCDGASDCLDLDCCFGASCTGGDVDGDLHLVCEDCDDANAAAWSTPGAVEGLVLRRSPADAAVLYWQAPAVPGATSVEYQVVRATGPTGTEAVTCLAGTAATTATDTEAVPSGGLFVYRVRAVNACPEGEGPLGEAPDEATIDVTCP